MTTEEIIPHNYEQWRDCITIRCGLALTSKYIEQRLNELTQSEHPKTKEFVRLYGVDHLRRTISWFERASKELQGTTEGRHHA